MNLTKKSLDFSAWMKKVDECVCGKVGLSVHDLEDCPFQDWYADGKTPQTAANKAIRNSFGNGREF